MKAGSSSKVAVLGTYRSGSTALAGVLHHLGVDMGAPFHEDFYEPDDLSRQLRQWWNEPHLTQKISTRRLSVKLRRWIKQKEGRQTGIIGAKHPLLALCSNELVHAWGTSTHFIWSYRALDKSIDSLKRLGWWAGREEYMQKKIYSACEEFFRSRESLRVDYDAMLENPAREIQKIIHYLKIQITDAQLEKAISSIKKVA